MTDSINEIIGELQTQIDIMDESSLKDELSDEEYLELKLMKIRLQEMIEAANEL